MKPFPHTYHAQLTGGPFDHANITTAGAPVLHTAPPIEFDGTGDAWSPEQLFLAAIRSCYLFTLRAIARLSKLDFVTLDLDARGTVDRQDRITRFTDITLRARLTVQGVDHARALAVLEKVNGACLVSASISTPIRVEAQVRDVEQPALPAAS